MEIKIDTERDSKEQLALLAEFLRKIAGAGGGSYLIGEPAAAPQGGGIFNMFDTEKAVEPAENSTSQQFASQGNENPELFDVLNSNRESLDAEDLLNEKSEEVNNGEAEEGYSGREDEGEYKIIPY